MAESTRRPLSPEQREQMRSQRHESRASATYARFLKELCANLSVSEEQAERAATSVLCALDQRLVGYESAHLQSQLPEKLQELLARCERHEDLLPRDIGRDAFLEMVGDDLDVMPEEAESIIRGVLTTLSAHVSPGEIQDVLSQLPGELRELWPPIPQEPNRLRGAAPARRDVPPEPAPEVVDDMLALPQQAQLGVLRTVAPRVLAELAPEEREGFMRALNEEMERVARGEPAYDIRESARATGLNL